MNQPIKKRRRRRIGNSEPLDLNLISRTKTEPTDTEFENEHPSLSTLQTSVDSITTQQTTIDRIRSEINEDNYHQQLDEPHYSNDSHDWGDNLESASSDYWHFLGRYE